MTVQANEIVRVAAYLFIGLVALLFCVRMYIRARRTVGRFAFPPHWYDVVAAYFLGIFMLLAGIGLRISIKSYVSPHTVMVSGFPFLAIAVFTSATALYFWLKPRKLYDHPGEVPPPPLPEIKDDSD